MSVDNMSCHLHLKVSIKIKISPDVFLYKKNPVYKNLRKEIFRPSDNMRVFYVSVNLSETCTSSF